MPDSSSATETLSFVHLIEISFKCEMNIFTYKNSNPPHYLQISYQNTQKKHCPPKNSKYIMEAWILKHK